MRTEKFEFTGYNGVKLPAVLWLPEGEPKKLLQITHGMTEHIGRYTALAESLTAQGIAAAGFDLRGHGENPGDPDTASFGEGGWEASLEDMHLFFDMLGERFSGVPHYMLGFSLGSFLLREYTGKYPDGVAGAAVMGTGHQPAAVLAVMQAIVQGEIKKAGFDKTTDLVQQLSFETYNRNFKPNLTRADWLCSDITTLDGYLFDPLCRKNISAGLFWQMLGAMKRTGGKDAYVGWKQDVPVLLISGQDDPVGSAGRGVQKVKAQMEKAGLRNVELQLLPHARHDVLHEEKNGVADTARKLLADWMERNG